MNVCVYGCVWVCVCVVCVYFNKPTNYLTPWNKFPLQQVIYNHPVKETPVFYGTPRLTDILTTFC